MRDRRDNDGFQTDVLNTLGDIKVLCERNACHNEAVTLRVTKLEAAQTRQWWVSYVITPIVVLASSVARAMGVKI